MPEAGNTQIRLVRDLMTVGVPTCTFSTPILDLARKFLEQGWEAVVVLDDIEGHALGVVSQDELVRAFAGEVDRNGSAGDIMRDGVPQIPPDIPLSVAAQIMQDNHYRVLYLMHHAGGIEYPAAMISYRHLIRLYAAEEAGELRDLGIHAERQAPLDQFIQRRDAARNKNRNF
jgi:CBS domain-containing protein